MIVLVTGDRDLADRAAVRARLERLPRDALVIHGACHLGGADALADEEARALGMRVKRFPADWGRYGRGAGPVRNQAMVDSRPDLCVAFVGALGKDSGTADCARRAEAVGIPVEVIVACVGV